MSGKPIRKSFYADGPTKAKKLYREYLQNEKTPIERIKTVAQWAEQWLEIYKKDKIAYKSYKNYELYLNKHIIPALGKLKLKDVIPAHIKQFYRDKTELSASAQRHMRIALNGIFETAIDNRFCSSNPTPAVKDPKQSKAEPEIFDADEVTAILEAQPKKGLYLLCNPDGSLLTPHQFEGRYKTFFENSGNERPRCKQRGIKTQTTLS